MGPAASHEEQDQQDQIPKGSQLRFDGTLQPPPDSADSPRNSIPEKPPPGKLFQMPLLASTRQEVASSDISLISPKSLRNRTHARQTYPKEPKPSTPELKNAVRTSAISLHKATKRGDVRSVITVLEEAKRVNLLRTIVHTPDKLGNSPLFYSAWYGHKDCLETLITRVPGIRVNKTNFNGWTPFHAACFSGNLRCVRYLVETPAERNYAAPLQYNVLSHSCWTPLFTAVLGNHPKVVRYLIRLKGVNVNQPASSGTTPLILAAKFGHANCIQALMRSPAIHLTMEDVDGNWALYYAVEKNWHHVVRLLLKAQVEKIFRFKSARRTSKTDKKASRSALPAKLERSKKSPMRQAPARTKKKTGSMVNIFDALLTSPSMRAAANLKERREIQIIISRLDQVNKIHKFDRQCPLYLAARLNHLESMELLSQLPNLDVNLKGPETALTACAKYGNAICAAFILRRPGIRVNTSDNDANTPLHHAVLNRHCSTVKLLNSHPKLAVNMGNMKGYNALSISVVRGDVTMISSLITNPFINCNYANTLAKTPLGIGDPNYEIEGRIPHINPEFPSGRFYTPPSNHPVAKTCGNSLERGVHITGLRCDSIGLQDLQSPLKYSVLQGHFGCLNLLFPIEYVDSDIPSEDQFTFNYTGKYVNYS